jgi:hypothetical protein
MWSDPDGLIFNKFKMLKDGDSVLEEQVIFLEVI